MQGWKGRSVRNAFMDFSHFFLFSLIRRQPSVRWSKAESNWAWCREVVGTFTFTICCFFCVNGNSHSWARSGANCEWIGVAKGGNAYMDFWEFLYFRAYTVLAVSEMKRSKSELNMAINKYWILRNNKGEIRHLTVRICWNILKIRTRRKNMC